MLIASALRDFTPYCVSLVCRWGWKMLEKRILLVEDDLELAEVMATVLREEGYLVDLAATAGQAQEHLARFSYAVVIADWRLPDGDGTLIAEWGSTLGAKTLVMSGYLRQMPGGRAEPH